MPEQDGELKLQKVEPPDAKVESPAAKVASSQPKGGKVATSKESQVAIKRRMSYMELQGFICSICADWRMLEQIATITGRDLDYLRNKIIPSVVAEKKLEMMFFAPNHPQQKYQAVSHNN